MLFCQHARFWRKDWLIVFVFFGLVLDGVCFVLSGRFGQTIAVFERHAHRKFQKLSIRPVTNMLSKMDVQN